MHRSNRIERLVDALADVVAAPLSDPCARECIVVQGRGMERWLSMQLARRLGVWANPDFPFPRRVLQRAVTAVLGDAAAPAPAFEPEGLLWEVAALLPAFLGRPGFAPIARYLEGDRDAARRLQLAAHIAATFDRYVVYRPALLHDWDTGRGGEWQGELWRALVRRHGRGHLAARLLALLDALARGAAPRAPFPGRLCLFGISTLPPLYVETFAALARAVELHCFILSPSDLYWADIQTRRDQLRVLRRAAAAEPGAAAAPALNEGHPLLASLGRLGRDFQQVLESRVDYDEPAGDLYVDPLAAAPAPPTLLAALQSDMLRLTPGEAARRAPLAAGDTSIRVHACHGPMREAEVLLDQLTALFEADTTLAPHDVVVMTPSIDAYAPVIEAVFGAGEGAPRIPYRVADRRVRATSEVAEAFTAVLAALRGRLSAPQVLDLLRREPVRTRFAIAGDDVEVVRRWVVESGVRWASDAADRRRAGQPATDQNTWRFGLDRLLLGYAAPGGERTLFGGVLPYDDVEGGEAAVLGKLAELCDTLTALRAELDTAQPVAAWRDLLGRVLDGTVARTVQNAHEHQQLRAALAVLAERAAAAGFDEPLALEALQAQLDDELQRGAAAHGFLTGGVTFCELLPMRAIPFRVVCLMGLSDDAFPRRRRAVDFDLTALHPQPGDRSSRDDDRYLFLESILSARERLIITYVGQRITDNTELPPSVVVSDLLDALDTTAAEGIATQPRGHQYALDLGAASAGTAPPRPAGRRSVQRPRLERGRYAATPARQRVLIRHPLQPFSPRYFRAPADPALFSYATAYCAGAVALGGEPQGAPFVTAPLAMLVPSTRQVDLDALARFFENPSRAFLERRLGLTLPRARPPVEAREPLEVDALERWAIGDRLLNLALEGGSEADAEALARASGTLPIGALGRAAYAALRPEVDAVAHAAAARAAAGPPAVVEVDVVIAGTRVTGVLREVAAGGLRKVQFARPRGNAETALWLRHLVLHRIAAAPPTSWLIARPDSGAADAVCVTFSPVAQAEEILDILLDLFWGGMDVPLPLFGRASRAYAERLREAAGDRDGALAKAQAAFAGDGWGNRGDATDPYVHQLYGDRDPLATDFRLCEGWRPFADVALAVFGPLLAHREEAS